MTMAAGHLAIDWTPPVWKYGEVEGQTVAD